METMETHGNPRISENHDMQQYPSLLVVQLVGKNMNFREEAAYALASKSERAASLLLQTYPKEKCEDLLGRYTSIIALQNVPPGVQSIIVYVTLTHSKILYLDLPLEEKISTDEQLDLRKVMLRAKRNFPFLLLLLAPKGNQFYLGSLSRGELKPIAKGGKIASEYENDAPERVANFSDLHERKHQVIQKFLRYTDKKLSDLLDEYSLPVVVTGSPKLLGHFKALTRNARQIISCIQGNFHGLSLKQLLHQVGEHIDFSEMHQQKTLALLAQEKNKGNVSAGVANVWNRLMEGKGRILVVEENFHYNREDVKLPSGHQGQSDGRVAIDVVDDMIEVAILKGCEVEFIADDLLQDEQHVALIEYY